MEQSKEGGYTYTYDYDYCDNLLTTAAGEHTIERRYGKYGLEIAVSSDGSASGLLYGYDAMGRVSQKNQGNYEAPAQYQYTPKNLVASASTPLGTTATYSYDSNDRLTTVTADGKTYTYTYYDNGTVQSVTYPNGVVTSYTYDNANRVKTIVTKKGSTVIYNLSYTHDANGNILTETRNGKTTTYTYDSLNRLKTADYGDGNAVTYTYDATNNRTREDYANGDVKTYVYDECNRLIEIQLNGETTDTYEYNANGAVTKHNDTVYTYDQWGKLSGVAENGNTWYYTYDVDGIRTGKTGVQYFTDLNQNVVAEASNDGTKTAELVYGSQALARKVDGVWYYYLYNAHGDVISMTDGEGNVVNSYEYDAWGNILSETEAVENPIRYAGQYYDEELGQYYLRARYYDPSIGRFTSIDAVEGDITEPLDWNQYVYCRNNPVAYVDLSGNAAGQIYGQTGYGGIYDTTAYVNDRYNGGWTAGSWGTLEPHVPNFLMSDLERNANNCTLTAITRMFAYYRDNNGMNNIPNNATLYNDIKAIAENYGYSNEDGTFPTKINNIINDTIKKYGYNGKGRSIYVWDFNTVKTEIDAGRPLLFNIAFGYYGNHTVTVVGYHEFTKGEGIFKSTKKFIKVYDGWTNSSRYIDYSLINIGSFSTMRIE